MTAFDVQLINEKYTANGVIGMLVIVLYRVVVELELEPEHQKFYRSMVEINVMVLTPSTKIVTNKTAMV